MKQKTTNLLKYSFMLVILLIFMLPNHVSANTMDDWRNIRIDSEPRKELTADDIREAFKKSNNGDSPLVQGDNAEMLIKASVEQGINPYVMILMSIHESGWSGSNVSNSNNNFGGMQCSTRAEKCQTQEGTSCVLGQKPSELNGYICYSYYDSHEEYFADKAFLLRDSYVKNGNNTVMKLLNVYAPSFENDLINYVASMRSNGLKYFGVEYTDVDSGQYLEGGGTYTPSGGSSRKPYSSKDIEIFKDSLEQELKTGVANTGDSNALESPYLRYTFGNVTKSVYDKMMVVANVLVAVSIVYMSVMVATYALYVRGSVGEKRASKVIGNKLVQTYGDRRGILLLSWRIFLGILIIIFFYSRWYIYLFSLFYETVENVLGVF